MASERLTTSRLFTTSIVEGRIDVDEKYDKAYNTVMALTQGLTEKEAHDVLNKAIDDPNKHEEICLGLMVAILCDPQQAPRAFQDLMMVCRDSLKGVCDALVANIVGERYNRLLESTRKQAVWLARQLVRSGVGMAEGVVWCLLRQMAGGDVSMRNLWLAEYLCDMLRENRAWLDRLNIIVASTVYSFLRVLEDHQGPHLAALRQKEVNLVITLLREKFQECLLIGRDLVRLLQNVAKIPEIEAFWRDFLHNPGSLAPNFQGINQVLSSRTSRRFFVMRLTPEMEKMIVFLCSDVRFGMQKRYQDWFQRQFLNTPESQSLRCDLIRFIIGCIHPSNEVLCSDIIPRWAVIGWLLSSCTSPIATANCKLALFYDWLFFVGDTDNIMNIEPGILVMYHSLKPHPMLTTSLLDFLCRIIPQFHPSLISVVRAGVTTSLRQILEKRVIQNIEPLFDNPRMDPELRRLLRDTFPEFCSAVPATLHDEYHAAAAAAHQHSSAAAPNIGKMDLMAETGLDFGGGGGQADDVGTELNNHHHHQQHHQQQQQILQHQHLPSVEDDAMFSDEEDESYEGKSGGASRTNSMKGSGGSIGRSRIAEGVNAPNYSSSSTGSSVTVSTTTASTAAPHISTTATMISSKIHPANSTTTATDLSSSSSTTTSSNSSSSSSTSSLSKPLSSVSSNNSSINSGSNNITYSGGSNNTKLKQYSTSTTNDLITEVTGAGDSKVVSNNITGDSGTTGVSMNGGESVLVINGGRTTSGVDTITATGAMSRLAATATGATTTTSSATMTFEKSEQLNKYLDGLESDIKNILLDYKLEKEQSARCGLLQQVCDLILSEDLDEAEADSLAGALSLLLTADFSTNQPQLPQHITQESLRDTLERPIFIIFENLLSLTEDDHRRHSLLLLLLALHRHQPSTGYRLLFYVKAAARTRDEPADQLSLQVYRDLWKASGQKDLSGFIVRDLTTCSEDDPRLLCWLLPHLYHSFPKHTTGNAELVHLVLQRLDAAQLHDLVCLVLQGALTMFDNSSFANILDKSLSWESVEQFFLWQLARAHEIPVDCCLSVLHRLHFTSHAHSIANVHPEALSNILMMLRRESPSETLLKHLLQRELRPQDPTVATILQYWVQRYEDKMAKLLNDLVTTKPAASPNKRKRNQGAGGPGRPSSQHVTLDQLLSHLNHLRTECDQVKFFNLATMQDALQLAHSHCTQQQKKKYGDLFALIVDVPDEKGGKEEAANAGGSSAGGTGAARNKTVNNKRGRKPKPRKKPESESEEESSEEEDVKKPARKRKKNSNLFTSDSD